MYRLNGRFYRAGGQKKKIEISQGMHWAKASKSVVTERMGELIVSDIIGIIAALIFISWMVLKLKFRERKIATNDRLYHNYDYNEFSLDVDIFPR